MKWNKFILNIWIITLGTHCDVVLKVQIDLFSKIGGNSHLLIIQTLYYHGLLVRLVLLINQIHVRS